MGKAPRLLRSTQLRSLLWHAAGGKCEGCGADLDEGWHADHAIPWSQTHRTNVHEMQALCAPCNLKKGAGMPGMISPEPFTYNAHAMRPGQSVAIETILKRIGDIHHQRPIIPATSTGETASNRVTAIVLPTRYGKSDVIRVSAQALYAMGFVCCSVAMSPNTILRNQLGDVKHFDTARVRYAIASQPAPKVLILKTNPHNFTRNGEIFVSTTMSLVERQLSAFVAYVESMIARHGIPPAFFIDEAHTGSESNQWGKAVVELVKAGAYAILLTATPIRSDGKIIPGFAHREIGEEALRIKVPNRNKPADDGKVWINILEGCKRTVALIPHHETTFQEAWDEHPSPLCKITRVPFDADLSRIREDSTEDGGMLSEASESRIRRYLAPWCRHPVFIQEACAKLVRELTGFQRLTPDAAAILFCGNDRADDPGVNQHARMIADTLAELAPALHVVIATSADGDNAGSDLIERFRKTGDVLIVKQMASLGLDIPRLKVGVDLSSIRTYASSVQRMMRIATVYETVKHAVWITPDDCLSRGLFEHIVTSQGGEAVAADMSVVDEYQIESQEQEREAYIPNKAGASNFQDTLLNESTADRYEIVHQLHQAFPEFIGGLSHPEVDQRIAQFGLRISVETDAFEPAIDIAREADDVRKAITFMAKAITTKKIAGQHQLFPATIPTVYTEMKQKAGISSWVTVDETQHDLDILTRVRQAAQQLAVGYGVRPC